MLDTCNFPFFCGQISGTQNLLLLNLTPKHLLLFNFQQWTISTYIFTKITVLKVSSHLLLAESNGLSSLFHGIIVSVALNSNDHNIYHIFIIWQKFCYVLIMQLLFPKVWIMKTVRLLNGSHLNRILKITAFCTMGSQNKALIGTQKEESYWTWKDIVPGRETNAYREIKAWYITGEFTAWQKIMIQVKSIRN